MAGHQVRYAGEYTDPTGYLYLRARYYDPATAQFLTRDPLEATTGNPYGYTDGNPLQYTDPLGLIWGDIAQAVFGVQNSIMQMMNPLNQVSGLINLPSTVRSAYQEGGIELAVNQFNPVFHLITNASNGWDLAQNGCIAEAASAFTSATFDAASVVAVAAGGASASIPRMRGAVANPGQLLAKADRIEQHLARPVFERAPQNDAMLARIRAAATEGKPLSAADKAFMRHELTENWLIVPPRV